MLLVRVSPLPVNPLSRSLVKPRKASTKQVPEQTVGAGPELSLSSLNIAAADDETIVTVGYSIESAVVEI